MVKLPSGVIIRDSSLIYGNKSCKVRFYSTTRNNTVYKNFKDITVYVLNNLLKNYIINFKNILLISLNLKLLLLYLKFLF